MRKLAGAAAALIIVAALAAGFAWNTTPYISPTHVAAEFADGLAHGDAREVCATINPRVVRAQWGNQTSCQLYWAGTIGQAAAFGQSTAYRIVSHSYKGWREGKTELATVKAAYVAGGSDITIHLVKTRNGWRVEQVS